VLLAEERSVGAGGMSDDLGARASLWPGLLHQSDRLGLRHTLMAGGTARLGMAGCAARRVAQRSPTMTGQPAGGRVRWGRSEGEPVDQGAFIRRECLNRRDLGRVDMAADTEIPGVTGRAARRYGPAPAAAPNLGQLRVAASEPESRRLMPVGNRKAAHGLPR
jgi:hypothetical protein